jgi:hypothetical protein
MATTVAADTGTSGKKAARTAGKRSPEETQEPEKSNELSNNCRMSRIPENRMHQVSTIYSGRVPRVNPYLWWIIWCIGDDEYSCSGAVLVRFSSACHLVVR